MFKLLLNRIHQLGSGDIRMTLQFLREPGLFGASAQKRPPARRWPSFTFTGPHSTWNTVINKTGKWCGAYKVGRHDRYRASSSLFGCAQANMEEKPVLAPCSCDRTGRDLFLIAATRLLCAILPRSDWASLARLTRPSGTQR
jgi:hypothetical protein